MSTMTAVPPRIETESEIGAAMRSTVIPPPRVEVTPEELLHMPDEKQYELVDGVLVERAMGVLSAWVEMKLGHRLEAYCEGGDLGLVLGSSLGYRCFPWNPRQVRRADVSFVARDRLPAVALWPQGYMTIAPDLAVEVVSPGDLAGSLEQKLEEYQRAGVRLIWVIYPEVRSAWVLRADGTALRIRADGELSGEDVLPGFRCPLASVLPAEPPPAEDEEAAAEPAAAT